MPEEQFIKQRKNWKKWWCNRIGKDTAGVTWEKLKIMKKGEQNMIKIMICPKNQGLVKQGTEKIF